MLTIHPILLDCINWYYFRFVISDRLRRTGRAPRNLTAGYILKKDPPSFGKKNKDVDDDA